MSEIKLEPYITSEIMLDDYEENQFFRSYAVGDMEHEDHDSDLSYSAKSFPVGSKIVVMVPTCLGCGLLVGECDCESENHD